MRVDADALTNLDTETLRDGFQVTDDNPLVGLEGRAELLRSLGALVSQRPEIFARHDTPRPGGFFDHLVAKADWRHDSGAAHSVRAAAAVRADLAVAADAWRRAARRLLAAPVADTADATNGLVPLHKLSQWLAYSLIEPLQWAGFAVTDIDGLTGLAEYRNGGLFVDTGVLALRDPADATREHDVASPLVVEWRALTVALLDRLAEALRRASAWTRPPSARQSARRRHVGGGSPDRARQARRRLAADQIISDGTVF